MKVLISTYFYQSTGSGVSTRVVELSSVHAYELKKAVDRENKRKDKISIWGIRHEILELED